VITHLGDRGVANVRAMSSAAPTSRAPVLTGGFGSANRRLGGSGAGHLGGFWSGHPALRPCAPYVDDSPLLPGRFQHVSPGQTLECPPIRSNHRDIVPGGGSRMRTDAAPLNGGSGAAKRRITPS